MLVKAIQFFGQQVVLACDGRCEKAWGINSRPKVILSEDPDDYAFLADDELGTAPVDPGTYEGCHPKPRDHADLHRQNKWCARECERSAMGVGNLHLPSFDGRVYNKPGSVPSTLEPRP